MLEAWFVGSGVLRAGLSLDALRIPVLVLIGCTAALAVRRFDRDQRNRLLRGLIVVGCLHATVAVVEGVLQAAAGLSTLSTADDFAPLPRADGLVGNANALGVFLVATAALTAREWERRRHATLVAALAVQAIAVLLTGSRLAILLALCALGWFLWRTGSWKVGMLLAPWAAAAVTIVAVRFTAAPPDRLRLWSAALGQIAGHPISGRGPSAMLFDVPLGAALPTTHAHNEILQLAVEYGLVGTALVSGVLFLTVRALPRRGYRDPWVVVAAGSLGASGLTDFSLRVTGIALTAAALTALALLPPRGGMPPTSPEARISPGQCRPPVARIPAWRVRTPASRVRTPALRR